MGRLELDISKGLWTSNFPPPPGYLQTATGWLNTDSGNLPLYAFATKTTPSANKSTLGMFKCYDTSSAQYFFLAMTDGHIYRTQGLTTYVDLTKAGSTYSLTAPWSFCSYGDWVIATNGVDNPQVKKSVATLKSVTSITRVGGTATVTCTAHGFVNNDTVVIAGATQTDYNGSYSITRTGADTFTYTVANSPATPATGTITAEYGFQDLGGTPPKAKYVISHSESGQIIFANVTSNPSDSLAYPKRLYFSALQTAEDYTTTINGAGYQDFADVIGNCTGVVQQGGSGLVVTFDQSIVYGQWTGVNGLWWTFNPPINGRGAQPYSVVSSDGIVYGMDNYGFWAFDGSIPLSIDQSIKATFNKLQSSVCMGVNRDSVYNIVYWLLYSVPAPASNRNDYFSYNYRTKQWTYFSVADSTVSGYGLISGELSPGVFTTGIYNISKPIFFNNKVPYVMSYSATINNSLVSGFVGDPEEYRLIENVMIPGCTYSGSTSTWGSTFSATLTAYDSSFTAISGGTVTLNSTNFNTKTGLFDVRLSGNFFTITLTNVTPNVNKLLFNRVVLIDTETASKVTA